MYKSKILPLELESQKLGIDAQELAYRRGEEDFQLFQDFYKPLQESFVRDAEEGIGPQYERAARDARIATDTTFDNVEDQNRIELERRGVRPGSPGYGMGDTSLARAATQALGVRQAVEQERDRAEDVNFNRKAVALGRQPTGSAAIQSPGSPAVGPGGAASLYGAAGRLYGSNASFNAGQANTYGNNAANGIQAGIQLGTQAYDLYSKFANQAPTLNTTGNTSYSPNYTSSNPWANPAVGGPNNAFAEGGMVPELSRNQPGMVMGPAGRDQVPASIQGPDGQQEDALLTAGEIVIPTEIVMAKGTDFFDKLFEEGKRRKAERTKPQFALGRTG
ncbi:MAG TPA: hypothetical protein ENJ35_11380 [Gammaproteobacteria bacterium]|nr:hypothetical protein [Gammaproteobacteria bacterium]